MKDYYQLELDDMVSALNNKDTDIELLQKKLDIATKALKEYADRTNWIEGNFMCVYDGKFFADEESAEQALKEIEEVK